MYDLLIVGAGLTAATLVAELRGRLKICVVESRSHLGGNCFDDRVEGTMVHRYGPHIFHSPSARVTEYLSKFTQWVPYDHQVTALVRDGHIDRYVPFPYSGQTQRVLGRALTNEEIIDIFFRGYSQKMWGVAWEHLPNRIRGRVPKQTSERPKYYRDQFVALPKEGFTHMIENMLEGAEMVLGAPHSEWTKIAARSVVYTGRPDLIPVPGEAASIASREDLLLDFRTLRIDWETSAWPHAGACLHACSANQPWTRKTHFQTMTGGNSNLVSVETPFQAERDDPSPYYPFENMSNVRKASLLRSRIRALYPNLHLAGRLGCYRYFDMYQAVGNALSLVERLWKT